ncbi:MAG: hypothetical protein AAGA20_10615 [Planctomycetota bacterium]
MKRALLASLAGIPLAACMTSTTSMEPPGLDRAVLTPVPAVRAWVVLDDDAVIGSVVRYAENGSDGRFLYVVRNLWDQDLGVVDELGRAWRRVPHREDKWIGTGTVADGVRRILDVGDSASMSERPIEDVEDATREARGD